MKNMMNRDLCCYGKDLTTYDSVVVTPCCVDGKNVINQNMMSSANTKYIIKYDFILEEDIVIPEGCLIEFDGGSIANEEGNSYTITCDDTVIIMYQDKSVVLKNVELLDHYVIDGGGGNIDKDDNVDGKATQTLTKDVPLSSQMTKDNTIYIIRNDFEIGDQPLTVPAGCVLKFDEGSISNGTLVLDSDTQIEANHAIFGDDLSIENCKFKEWNAVWFGIKNGEVTNDTAIHNFVTDTEGTDIAPIIQRMIDTGCMNIYIPAGNYFWGSKVTCTSNLCIHSDYVHGNVWEDNNADATGALFFANSIKVSRTVDCMLEVGDVASGKAKALDMYGFNICCYNGGVTSILSGKLGWSKIHDNVIRSCGYLFYNFNEGSNRIIALTSKIYNNDIRSISRACFSCPLGDVEIYDNYVTGSGVEYYYDTNPVTSNKNRTYFVDCSDASTIDACFVHNNYIDYFYMVYNMSASVPGLFSTNNTYDITSCVFGSDVYRVNSTISEAHRSLLPTNPRYGQEIFISTDEIEGDYLSYTRDEFLNEHYRENFDADGCYPYSFADDQGHSFNRYRYNGTTWFEVRRTIIVECISSVGDNFLRINNWEYTGASYTWEENDFKNTAQSTRGYLKGSQTADIPPRINIVGSPYYTTESCYAILKVMPVRLVLEIGEVKYVDYIFQRGALYLTNSRGTNKIQGYHISIIGGIASMFKFRQIYNYRSNGYHPYTDYVVSDFTINIPALTGKKVVALPTTELYDSRTAYYSGSIHYCDNGTWN